ncbi:MAG: RHS repeat-associated core domain-containing protein [Chloroflexota bacterium]
MEKIKSGTSKEPGEHVVGTCDRLRQVVAEQAVTYTLDLNTGLTQILYDGTNTYLYGNGRIAQDGPAGSEYFLGDALGSVRQMTDVHGAVTYTAAYSPYGERRGWQSAEQTPYGFAGEYTDSYTGEWEDSYIKLIYLRSRYYSPMNGQFLTRDSWQGDYNRPLSLNRWAYVEGNPINYTDPSGHDPICNEYGDCYDHGKLVRQFKTRGTNPDEYLLKVLYESPIRDETQNRINYSVGDPRGEYCTHVRDSVTNELVEYCAGTTAYHPGLDMGDTVGTPIFSSLPGIIVYSGWSYDFGYVVILETNVEGHLFYTIYAHLGSNSARNIPSPTTQQTGILVTPGQLVVTGSPIGFMGTSKGGGGVSPHLHTEIRTAFNVGCVDASTNIYPLSGTQWWIFEDGPTNWYRRCTSWDMCWVDLGSVHFYDPEFPQNFIP